MLKSFTKPIQLLLAAALMGCESEPIGPTEGTFDLQTSQSETQGALLAGIRAATAKFHDIDVALAAGYVRASPCIYNTPGSKAVHFFNPALVNGVIDPLQPEILLYEPRKNGDFRLVGVEYLVPAAVWDATHTAPPSLGEQTFMDRRTPPFGADFPNYALYAWIWRHNPSGMHEQYNPNVSCEFADVAVIR